ncbi:hypothetical protein AKJ16_DCAP21562 [Drosera capensis]
MPPPAPLTYSLDSHAKSAALAATILSSTTPSSIGAALAAVEYHLASHSPDLNRHFFSLSFPALISQLLFNTATSTTSPSSPSPPWIEITDDSISHKLIHLLSPHGVIFDAINAVDRLSLVKFVFPIERLPQWVRLVLSSSSEGRLSDLCGLFRGKVKEGTGDDGVGIVELDVFEYYMFWFAYYPVCRGSDENENCSSVVSLSRNRRSRLENWTSSIPMFSGSGKRGESERKGNVYFRLLYSYLRAFVPLREDGSNGGSSRGGYYYRSSALLQYSGGGGYEDNEGFEREEFFVNTLLQFWLVDNDFSPFPVNVGKSFGVVYPFRQVLGESPPIPGLGQVVKLLVDYLNLGLHVVYQGADNRNESGCSSVWRGRSGSAAVGGGLGEVLSVSSAHSWNSVIQRPLYRFILRTFLFCPMGASMKNVAEVVDVWISYAQPWRLREDDFAGFDDKVHCMKKAQGKDGESKLPEYSSTWQGYVLANYLFYTSLVMHFIGFAHKFLLTDTEMIVQLLSKVLIVLTSSKELLELIKNVDKVYHSQSAGSGKSMLNNLYKFVAPLREQLQDWEDGLCERDVDGSFLHEDWNKDLQLFSAGEDGGQRLLQLFMLRAESEFQRSSSIASNLQSLNSLKAQVGILFGAEAMKPTPSSPKPIPQKPSHDELFSPRRLGWTQSMGDIKFKGEWMRRPVSGDEVAWLAKLLVHFSCWINEALGLDQGEEHVSENHPGPAFVDLHTNRLGDHKLALDLRHMLHLVGSWILMSRIALVKMMVKNGVKVNLRVLASKKFLAFVLSFIVFSMLKRAFISFS